MCPSFEFFFGNEKTLEELEESEKIECAYCEGTGKVVCIVCNGLGTHTLKKGYEECTFCNGHGHMRGSMDPCSHCGGKGVFNKEIKIKLTCPYCRGTGKGQWSTEKVCIVCEGKGHNVVREGYKVCGFCGGRGHPLSSGKLVCLDCKGTGVIE